MAINATTLLSTRERLAPVAIIGMDDETDDRTDGWNGQPNITASEQNQGYYISRCHEHITLGLGLL